MPVNAKSRQYPAIRNGAQWLYATSRPMIAGRGIVAQLGAGPAHGGEEGRGGRVEIVGRMGQKGGPRLFQFRLAPGGSVRSDPF